MNITPEMIALLPPELRQQLRAKMIALLDDLGVPFKLGPAGDLTVDLEELAPALGMTVENAAGILAEAGQGAVTERGDE